MKTLSVVLAVFNEEKNLEKCLQSVKDLANEIVIVDGGSSDKTVSIARQFGAKVVITNNPPIFHINKQKAIDLATKDWILQLDADERVSSELAQEIKEKIKNSKLEIENSVNGYWIPRKNWFLGKFLMKGGVYPDYTLRLYKNGKGKLPQKDVHEQAIVQGKIGYLIHPLIHVADTSFKHYLFRFNRYTDLIATELSTKKITTLPVIFFIDYLFFEPIFWFLNVYIRHKGFVDGWQGFVFSFFSSLRFPVSYIKYIKRKV